MRPWLAALILPCALAAFRRIRQRGGGPRLSSAERGWVVQPTGPVEKPQGRHIQYLYRNNGHGLTDRADHFRQLAELGAYHNATTHISGGVVEAGQWLAQRHTGNSALGGWDRYFDVHANGGNPFHPLHNFTGCKELDVREGDMRHIFDDGSLCVNIREHIHNFALKRAPQVSLQPSPEALRAAERFMAENSVPPSFGAIHIRRCDRLSSNAKCTEPGAIYDAVSRQGGNLTTWVVFAYAEPGYIDLLEERLKPLGRRFLFEDRLAMNTEHPEDNYFTYVLGKYIAGAAATIIETHICAGRAEPATRHGNPNGLHLTSVPFMYGSEADVEEDAEEGVSSLCGGVQQLTAASARPALRQLP